MYTFLELEMPSSLLRQHRSSVGACNSSPSCLENKYLFFRCCINTDKFDKNILWAAACCYFMHEKEEVFSVNIPFWSSLSNWSLGSHPGSAPSAVPQSVTKVCGVLVALAGNSEYRRNVGSPPVLCVFPGQWLWRQVLTGQVLAARH